MHKRETSFIKWTKAKPKDTIITFMKLHKLLERKREIMKSSIIIVTVILLQRAKYKTADYFIQDLPYYHAETKHPVAVAEKLTKWYALSSVQDVFF